MIRCVCVCVCMCSVVSDSFVSPWMTACQACLSMGFSRQGYWSGFPFPTPGDLPKSGIKLRSPALQADSLLSEPPGKPLHVLKKKEPELEFKSVLCVLYFANNGPSSQGCGLSSGHVWMRELDCEES